MKQLLLSFLSLLTFFTQLVAFTEDECRTRSGGGKQPRVGRYSTDCLTTFDFGGYYEDSGTCVYFTSTADQQDLSVDPSQIIRYNFSYAKQKCELCQGRLLNINPATGNYDNTIRYFFQGPSYHDWAYWSGATLVDAGTYEFKMEGFSNTATKLVNLKKEAFIFNTGVTMEKSMEGSGLLFEYEKSETSVTQKFGNKKTGWTMDSRPKPVVGFFCEIVPCNYYAKPNHKVVPEAFEKQAGIGIRSLLLYGETITVACADSHKPLGLTTVRYKCMGWKGQGWVLVSSKELVCQSKRPGPTSTRTIKLTTPIQTTTTTTRTTKPSTSIQTTTTTRTTKPSTSIQTTTTTTITTKPSTSTQITTTTITTKPSTSTQITTTTITTKPSTSTQITTTTITTKPSTSTQTTTTKRAKTSPTSSTSIVQSSYVPATASHTDSSSGLEVSSPSMSLRPNMAIDGFETTTAGPDVQLLSIMIVFGLLAFCLLILMILGWNKFGRACHLIKKKKHHSTTTRSKQDSERSHTGKLDFKPSSQRVTEEELETCIEPCIVERQPQGQSSGIKKEPSSTRRQMPKKLKGESETVSKTYPQVEPHVKEKNRAKVDTHLEVEPRVEVEPHAQTVSKGKSSRGSEMFYTTRLNERQSPGIKTTISSVGIGTQTSKKLKLGSETVASKTYSFKGMKNNLESMSSKDTRNTSTF